MPKFRQNRINDAVMQQASVILREVKDPRVSGLWITVTGADVSQDLKYAKIFYSVLGEYDEKELRRGLKSVAPFVRSRLAKELNLRVTPEIAFVFDESVARGAEISAILRDLNVQPEEPEDAVSEEDGDGGDDGGGDL